MNVQTIRKKLQQFLGKATQALELENVAGFKKAVKQFEDTLNENRRLLPSAEPRLWKQRLQRAVFLNLEPRFTGGLDEADTKALLIFYYKIMVDFEQVLVTKAKYQQWLAALVPSTEPTTETATVSTETLPSLAEQCKIVKADVTQKIQDISLAIAKLLPDIELRSKIAYWQNSRRRFPKSHKTYWRMTMYLASAYLVQEDFASAALLLKQLREVLQRKDPTSYSETEKRWLSTINNLVDAEGRFKEAPPASDLSLGEFSIPPGSGKVDMPLLQRVVYYRQFAVHFFDALRSGTLNPTGRTQVRERYRLALEQLALTEAVVLQTRQQVYATRASNKTPLEKRQKEQELLGNIKAADLESYQPMLLQGPHPALLPLSITSPRRVQQFWNQMMTAFTQAWRKDDIEGLFKNLSGLFAELSRGSKDPVEARERFNDGLYAFLKQIPQKELRKVWRHLRGSEFKRLASVLTTLPRDLGQKIAECSDPQKVAGLRTKFNVYKELDLILGDFIMRIAGFCQRELHDSPERERKASKGGDQKLKPKALKKSTQQVLDGLVSDLVENRWFIYVPRLQDKALAALPPKATLSNAEQAQLNASTTILAEPGFSQLATQFEFIDAPVGIGRKRGLSKLFSRLTNKNKQTGEAPKDLPSSVKHTTVSNRKSSEDFVLLDPIEIANAKLDHQRAALTSLEAINKALGLNEAPMTVKPVLYPVDSQPGPASNLTASTRRTFNSPLKTDLNKKTDSANGQSNSKVVIKSIGKGNTSTD